MATSFFVFSDCYVGGEFCVFALSRSSSSTASLVEGLSSVGVGDFQVLNLVLGAE